MMFIVCTYELKLKVGFDILWGRFVVQKQFCIQIQYDYQLSEPHENAKNFNGLVDFLLKPVYPTGLDVTHVSGCKRKKKNS